MDYAIRTGNVCFSGTVRNGKPPSSFRKCGCSVEEEQFKEKVTYVPIRPRIADLVADKNSCYPSLGYKSGIDCGSDFTTEQTMR